MSPGKDLEHFSESMDDMFRRLGLPDPVMMAALTGDWDQFAGPPWSGRSKPLYLRGTTLVVEAASASMVAFLRYGETTLLEKLASRFGEGIVKSVDIQAPERH
jgi:predicted nucleic acid-binding Zn ribbon protein